MWELIDSLSLAFARQLPLRGSLGRPEFPNIEIRKGLYLFIFIPALLLRLANICGGTDALANIGALRQHTPTGLPFSKFPARAETPLENLDGGPCSASAVSAAGSASAAQHFIRRRRRFGVVARPLSEAGAPPQTPIEVAGTWGLFLLHLAVFSARLWDSDRQRIGSVCLPSADAFPRAADGLNGRTRTLGPHGGPTCGACRANPDVRPETASRLNVLNVQIRSILPETQPLADYSPRRGDAAQRQRGHIKRAGGRVLNPPLAISPGI